jgi:hypothetical protein
VSNLGSEAVPDQRVWDPHSLGTENQLALLETRDYLGQRYRDLHGGGLNQAKAREISAHTAQGRAYFAAAAEADELVKPLLQYYGVLAFSRAVVLFRTRVRESALKQSHGLCVGDWNAAFESPRKFLNADVRVESGTFTELCEAVSNTEIVDIDCYPERAFIRVDAAPILSAGGAVTFGELLERMPQIRDLYRTATGGQLSNWETRINSNNGFLSIDVLENGNAIVGASRLRELTDGASGHIEENIHRYAEIPDVRSRAISFRCTSPSEWARHLSNVRSPGKFVGYLTEPFSAGANMPTIAVAFVAAYMLGMLVRYFPSQWAEMVSRRHGDPLLPVIRAVDGVVASYPSMFLDALAVPLSGEFEPRKASAASVDGDPVLAFEGETEPDRQRREYKMRLRREREERESSCAHRRITKTSKMGGAVFTCDTCGKNGDSVDAIRS